MTAALPALLAPGLPTTPRTAFEGDPAAEARLARAFAEYVDAAVPLRSYALRRPRAVTSALADIRRMPLVRPLLPPTAEAQDVVRMLMAHAGTRRAMSGISAVLRLPETPGTYLDGHERATVRRKVRAAARLGVTVRPVPLAERPALLEAADRHERENERDAYRIEQPDNADLLDYAVWHAAYDADGTAIMLAVTPHAGQWATLRYFRTLVDGQAASDARYLMAQVVAEALAAQGVRYLVDTARPHWLPNGLRHFQRMIGFRLLRVAAPRVRAV